MLVHYNFALDPADRLAYQCHDTLHTDSFYPRVLSEVGRLDSKLQGPIWVVDDALYYFLSQRMPSVQQSLQADYLLPEQWGEFEDQVQQSQPRYIFIQTAYSELIPSRSTKIQKFIERNYTLLHRGDVGTWYVIHLSVTNQLAKGRPNG